eukprot:12585555-Ditylum_brightwellii.AAC.1
MYNLAVPFFDTGSVEDWLKCWQNLQAIITGQNITDAQGMYAITKSMLHKDVLTAFENTKEVNRPQTELNYQQTMKDVHTPMFPLCAYVTQTWYMHQTLAKPRDMSLCAFVAHVNKMNDQLEQFSPTDDRAPQVKLAKDK